MESCAARLIAAAARVLTARPVPLVTPEEVHVAQKTLPTVGELSPGPSAGEFQRLIQTFAANPEAGALLQPAQLLEAAHVMGDSPSCGADCSGWSRNWPD